MSTFWKVAVGCVSLAGMLLAVGFVMFGQKEAQHAAEPISPPPTSPYAHSLAGAGLVEAESENIALGASVAGLVKRVHVREGDRVTAGTVLVELDDRDLLAQRQIQQAAVESATADLARQQHLPRPEDVPVQVALLNEAAANLHDRETELERTKRLFANNAATQQELDSAQNAYDVAAAQRDKSQADLERLKAGAWVYEIQQATAALDRAKAQLGQVETQLDLLRVTAPIDGEILQVNVRPGEFVGGPTSGPLFIMGETRTLNVRVDIDENDIPLYRVGIPAIARLRGGFERDIPLTFVRVEPYVIPKVSLTGADTERTDTRVLQVIYRIDGDTNGIYVGQQVDVFFDLTREK